VKPKFSKAQVVERMKHGGLVPLFTTDNYQDAIQVVEASYFAGVRTFEFTNRRKNSFDVFAKVLEYCEQFPDLMLGIGTIMDGETTEKFIDAGAHFIISPMNMRSHGSPGVSVSPKLYLPKKTEPT
jgi:2-dehydro-3-deoxyphosphogluconate aldolase/(4S)-4-hydroxy-2-oxoglutarate aldolase